MDPVRSGTQAALKLFGIFIGIQIVLFVAALLFSPLALLVAFSGFLLVPAALITAALTSAQLQPGARQAFWLCVIAGVVCVAAVWLTTCGRALELL